MTKPAKTEHIEVTDFTQGYSIFTNTDLTEGRGYTIVDKVNVSTNFYTATRLSYKRGIQGSNAEVTKVDLFRYKGLLYGPVNLELPTSAEIESEKKENLRQAQLAAKSELLQKLAKLGITDKELDLLK